jgi:hypothetical protein
MLHRLNLCRRFARNKLQQALVEGQIEGFSRIIADPSPVRLHRGQNGALSGWPVIHPEPPNRSSYVFYECLGVYSRIENSPGRRRISEVWVPRDRFVYDRTEAGIGGARILEL